MSRHPHRSILAFTLAEIMIVLAIIALIASIGVPNYLRARKRSQASRVLNDLRAVDNALDRWAIENNKSAGDVAQFSDIQPYIKTGQLASSGADLLGHAMGPFSVDSIPKIPTLTFNALSDVAPAAFWSPYY